jgi:hypothetical protein
MSSRKKRLTYSLFVSAVSVFGLAISLSVPWNPAPSFAGFHQRIVIVAAVYATVCVLGILAVLFPTMCSGVFGFHQPLTEDREDLGSRVTRILGVPVLHGHHPLGPQAIGRELRVRRKTFCATCFGLLTGAMFSLVTLAIFALQGWPAWVDRHLTYFLYFAGITGVILGLVQTATPRNGARTKFLLATIFVAGTSLVLVATDVLTENLMADLLVVLLAVFWLLSRVSLSHGA